MKKVMRCQYRAALQETCNAENLQAAISLCKTIAQKKKAEGKILTCAMFHHERMVFLYLEYLVDEGQKIHFLRMPDDWFHNMNPFLTDWPELTGRAKWAYMYPVFYFDIPQDLEQWKRKKIPEHQCGRIAILYPDKLFPYVCHHQAIVKEGLLVGDRYQSIALHENVLFSYFEEPRDAERVNIRKQEGKSQEIEEWEKVNPASHFYHFPQANGENFLVIPSYFTVG